MKGDTKDQIKNRMLRKASDLWKIPANEINESFDPLVSMLIATCASELEQLSGEIYDSQAQITERLIQLLTPDTVYDAKPAHSIAHIGSIEPTTVITPEYMLFHKKKEDSDMPATNFTNFFFSSIQDTTLVGAKLSHMITGQKCFQFGTHKSKELLHIFEQDKPLAGSTVYLGITSDLEQIPLENVSVYFENQGTANTAAFYYHLRNAKWFIEGEELEVSEGYWNTGKNDPVDLETIFGGVSTKTTNVIDTVRRFYQKHYITLSTEKKELTTSSFSEIETLLVNEKTTVPDNLRWIKIEFPTVLSTSVLEKLFCSFNTFPVLNRKKEHFSYQLKNYINIIPILSDTPFLDIKSVSNTKGVSYKLQHSTKDATEKGTYHLRNQNVGKLDSRKAKEYLQHLIELLKNESAAFSFFNQEFLESNINSLNQSVALLERKTEEIKDSSRYANYVYIKPITKSENILVDYWTTEGAKANELKSGLALESYQGAALLQKSGYIVTPVFGGQDKLSMEQRLDAYRSISLSRNRIITAEDIKALCYELYGNKIKDVFIKNGFMKDIARRKGVLQCIEIHISPNSKQKTAEYEWEYLNENLLNILKKQSLNIYPFQVIVDQNQKQAAS